MGVTGRGVKTAVFFFFFFFHKKCRPLFLRIHLFVTSNTAAIVDFSIEPSRFLYIAEAVGKGEPSDHITFNIIRARVFDFLNSLED